MRIRLFCHSILSDWNHGNAHFLRGVVRELLRRGHAVRIYEPRDAWSLANLVEAHGESPLAELRNHYPPFDVVRYDPATLDLGEALAGADLVIVHEWNDPALVAAIGNHRRRADSYALLFHDTHHRMVTAPADMGRYDLAAYDGVLAFGDVIRRLYLERRAARRAWTWHEAADVVLFRPHPAIEPDADLAWIGNWGDNERSAELREFLLGPVRALGLRANIWGVRYPDDARAALRRAGVSYHGWLPNFKAPEIFARHRVTVHVPRRPYVEALPGIPTIRPFEALACGIPLVCSPWNDAEGLFTPGRDYLVAHDGRSMRETLRGLLDDPERAAALARRGRRTILARHTCAHRVEELLAICAGLGLGTDPTHEPRHHVRRLAAAGAQPANARRPAARGDA